MSEPLTAKQLREERAPVVHQIRELADLVNAEERDFSPEEQEKWDKLNRDCDLYKNRIEKLERAAELVAELEAPVDEAPKPEQRKNAVVGTDGASLQPTVPNRDNYDGRTAAEEQRQRQDGPTEEQRALAIQGWMRAQKGEELRPDHTRACELTGIRPHRPDLVISLRRDTNRLKQEFRAQSAYDGSGGGFLSPEGFVNQLEAALLQFGGMRQVADLLRTTSGNDMPWPTVNDTSNTGRLLGESQAVTETAVTFGQTIFRSYKYSSDLVLVPHELLQDSAFNLVAMLAPMLGERLGRAENADFTTGSGVGRPKGIVNSATSESAGSATAVSGDDIYNLVHAVDPAYRAMSPQFMLHDTILRDIRKLKDGQGRYLWEPSVKAGVPDTLAAYPIVNNQQMASAPASGAFTIIFGELSKYKIRDVGEIRMRRLVERYADQDQEGFVAFMSTDGHLLNAGTNPVVRLAH